MNTKERNDELVSVFKELAHLYDGKGKEYANDSDVLKNFKRGNELGISSYQKLGVYLDKHISSINSFIANGGKTFSNESIHGRINDAIAYLFLLRCLIKDSEKEPKKD